MTRADNFYKILLLTMILFLMIVFLTHASADPRWGAGYWDRWLVAHFGITPVIAWQIVFWLRKTLHFLGYGLLGLLFWHYFALWRLRGSFWIGMGALALVASYDEYLQSLTAFRTGKPGDVLLDACGGLALCSLYWCKRRFAIGK